MRLPVGVKVGLFALVVMGTYTYYANSIPQIESRPPQELSLEAGNVTTAELVKAGEEIFNGKGTCTICHRIGQPGTRAPDLAGIGARAAKRKPGTTATGYIVESLLTPGAFVVEGYPNIMPAVDRAPINLNRSELWAVTAYLESLGGTVTAQLDDIPGRPGRGPAGRPRRRPPPPCRGTQPGARRSSPARGAASPATRLRAWGRPRSAPTSPRSPGSRPPSTS